MGIYRSREERPKATKADQERFLAKKAAVDEKRRKFVAQEKLRISKLLEKRNDDI